MDFDLSDEQREIKSTAREFIAARFKPEKVRELAESENPYDDAIWAEMCELGWPGIAISEQYGGQGLGVVELAILQEELGYACAPSPSLRTMTAAPAAAPTTGSSSAGAKAAAPRCSPAAMPGSQRLFCSSDPAVSISAPAKAFEIIGEGAQA